MIGIQSFPNRRTIANAVGLTILVAVVTLFAVVAVPQLTGADESYVVQSDSMSPTIQGGDVVFVERTPPEQIDRGDIITYRRGDGERSLTTHRVVGIEERDDGRYFETKGDANEDPDQQLVHGDAVVGRVAFHLPYVGYAISFAGSKLGVALLLIVPGTLLVVTECWSLYRAVRDNGSESPSESSSEGGQREPTDGATNATEGDD